MAGTEREAEAVALYTHAAASFSAFPVEAYGPIALVIVAIVGLIGVLVGHFVGARGKARADAGQLALEYATGLRGDIAELRERVTTLETQRDGYRSHALHLHEWGGHVETPEQPRPHWPEHLPR